MRLPDAVIAACKKAGIKTYYADRRHIRYLNDLRISDEPGNYGGWYWQRTKGGKVIETDTSGPFRSNSAALRDAFMRLQLQREYEKK